MRDHFVEIDAKYLTASQKPEGVASASRPLCDNRLFVNESASIWPYVERD
jgi:hypothetical protein